jgi:tripartite-type tricarboxylate transporter receptor subunit TctC
MSNRRHLLAGAAAAVLSGLARAQSDAPRENLRIVCGFPAGGTADTVARRLSDGATPALARASVVETKTGAGGQIAVQFVKSAPTDGSTLLLTPLAILSTYPHTFVKLPYDSLNDFVAVGAGASFEYAIGVGPKVPTTVKNIADLMKWCKLAPTNASFGSPAPGAAAHFIGVLIGKSAGVEMTHVAYRGTPPAILDMVGGQIPIVIGPVGEFLQYAKDGRCRIIATSGDKRSRFSPEVATLKEQGHPELTFDEWFAFFAPTGTPATVIDRTNAQIAQALTKPAVATNFAILGMDVQLSTPAELAARLRRDYGIWKEIVRNVGFTPQS